MKKYITFLLIAGLLLQYVSFAFGAEGGEADELKNKINKIESEIIGLKAKMMVVSSQARIAKIEELIEGHEARVEKLREYLAEMEKEKVLEEKILEEVEEPEIKEVIKEKEATEEAEAEIIEPQPRFKFEIGGTAGVFGASTSAFGEIRFPLRYIFGPATTSLRFAGGLAQTEDLSRRYAPIQVDGILNFPAGWFTGVENYLGAGLNYTVLTSGRTSGTIGGQVFYGVESNGFGGRFFGEMGYGVLRTGFTSSHKGLTVLVGYRRMWSF